MNTRGRALLYHLNGEHAETQAQFLGACWEGPAVVTNRYGSGRSILFAFDLAGMVTRQHLAATGGGADDPSLRQMVKAMSSATASAPSRVLQGDFTSTTLKFTNPGASAVTVKAVATLPSGVTHVSASVEASSTVPAKDTSPATVGWLLRIPAGGTQELTWRTKTTVVGDLDIPVAIYAGSASDPNPGRLQDTMHVAFRVLDRDRVIREALSKLEALPVPNPLEWPTKGIAILAVKTAIFEHERGEYANALVHWMNASNTVRLMLTTERREMLDELGWAARASTLAQCEQLQCIKRKFTMSDAKPKQGSVFTMRWDVQNECQRDLWPLSIRASIFNRRDDRKVLQVEDRQWLSRGRQFQRQEKLKLGGTTRAEDPKAGDTLDLLMGVSWQGHFIPMADETLLMMPSQ